MTAKYVNPNNEDHAAFEESVAGELSRMGFVVPKQLTYHSVWSDRECRAVARIDSATALYIRTRADRVAYCVETDFIFEWEVKTCHSCADLACEVLPFTHHILKHSLGVLCLYVFRNLVTRREYGIWVAPNCVPVREIHFPRGKSEYLEELVLPHFPGVQVYHPLTNRGSGDPLLIIDKEVAAKLPDWRDIVTPEGPR